MQAPLPPASLVQLEAVLRMWVSHHSQSGSPHSYMWKGPITVSRRYEKHGGSSPTQKDVVILSEVVLVHKPLPCMPQLQLFNRCNHSSKPVCVFNIPSGHYGNLYVY